MSVDSALQESEALANWIAGKIDGLEIPNPDRCRISAACFDMVLEHHVAIVLLTRHAIYGSAAALIRSQFEAHVRGIWLLFCASDAEIDAFKEDRLKKAFGDLIQEIEKIEAYSGGTFSYIKERSWKVMNSLTHTGFYQVIRRNTDTEIRADYSEAEILDALSTANSFAILAGVEVANMAKNEPLAREIGDRGNRYFQSAL